MEIKVGKISVFFFFFLFFPGDGAGGILCEKKIERLVYFCPCPTKVDDETITRHRLAIDDPRRTQSVTTRHFTVRRRNPLCRGTRR